MASRASFALGSVVPGANVMAPPFSGAWGCPRFSSLSLPPPGWLTEPTIACPPGVPPDDRAPGVLAGFPWPLPGHDHSPFPVLHLRILEADKTAPPKQAAHKEAFDEISILRQDVTSLRALSPAFPHASAWRADSIVSAEWDEDRV
jgi:hypothetical protein